MHSCIDIGHELNDSMRDIFLKHIREIKYTPLCCIGVPRDKIRNAMSTREDSNSFFNESFHVPGYVLAMCWL